MNIKRFSYSALLEKSEDLTYRNQVTDMATVLMTFFKENHLITVDPFNEDGSLKKDNFALYNSDFTEFGRLLFEQYVPKWSAYIDNGGDVHNTEILKYGLNILNVRRFSYSDLLKANKTLSYRKQVTDLATVLMTFFKENNLITVDPFKEDGSLKEDDFALYNSDFTKVGRLLFDQYFPKWSAYLDRGGDVHNTKILEKGLKALTNR
ncbi:hypothetical protein [Gilliamella sp. Bif1-4]|uniref:hypothetical protein n=1 Tax=Gilliamella sp. Bif1-4 TaxID=3120233 RepID=UPI001C401394|nr:hypothetical protein [Gilliamella apicola]